MSISTHYADDANGSDTPYHELAHCLGYGHSGNMTYYPAEGGFPTICMKVYSQLSVSKKLPVYSRRFLHTRRNKNLVENKTCILPRNTLSMIRNWMP